MRALIVDDSPSARAQARVALEEALGLLGMNVPIAEAGSGVEALRKLTNETIDILVVDLHMPDIHGLEVLSFWRKRGGPKTGRAVIVSTPLSDRDRANAISHGAHDFLDKPVSGVALKRALEGLRAGG